MKGRKIICLRSELDFKKFHAPAPTNFDVVYHEYVDDQLAALMTDAEILLIPAVGEKIPNHLLFHSRIKLVQVTGAGIDRLDAKWCAANNVKVCNVLGASAKAVAEYCVFAAISISRQLTNSSVKISGGAYVDYRNNIISERMYSLEGLKVGIVGFGSIGRKTAELFNAFGTSIQYFDNVDSVADLSNWSFAKKVDFKELIETSDIISLHVPLTKETTNLIDFEEFASMKSSAILINASRGGVVNELALSKAILNKSIKGAAIDVYESEPPGTDNPLVRLCGNQELNIVCTPHIAGVTSQSWTELFKRSWENIQRYFDGGKLENQQI